MKVTLSIATLIFSATLLAACGNQEPGISHNTAESATSDTGSITETDNRSTLSSSDNVKWDEIKDPLIDNAIKEKLKASVEAIVAKNVEAFHKTLGPDVGTEHDYLLDNPVNFTDVDKAYEENGRTLVQVGGKKQGDDTKEMGYTFYFEKDKSGEWQIITID
ncbi:hypothetical protein FHS19_003525 [Paenibacillus rhizosphaerae]|uniref:Uncharacterized protein n=1 Tax=Paenibacillus rhizosphaerae TaxID=297318 RepID=A0A839TT81_9BACL|nr:hypothetical protein [Paenibacillus rhizosphaerae]MBB3128850.1 hypothetical protein [Paenibacillus rhizosphaerae]